MCQRSGANIGNTQHFQHTRYMGITSLPLYSIGQIKSHSRPFTFQNARHKFLNIIDQVLITFQRNNLVPSLFQSINNPLDCSLSIFFPVRDTKKIDYLVTDTIINNGDLQSLYASLKCFAVGNCLFSRNNNQNILFVHIACNMLDAKSHLKLFKAEVKIMLVAMVGLEPTTSAL